MTLKQKTTKKVEEVVKGPNVEVPMPQKKLPSPSPQRLKKKHEDECFAKLISIIKKIHINLTLVDILQGIPKYAKYMKDIVASKRKITKHKIEARIEECNSRIQNRLPKMLKNLGNFTVQSIVEKNIHERGLCDMGEIINFMPLFLYLNLGLGCPKRTTIIL